MEPRKQSDISRLAICVTAALALYAGVEPLCTTLKLPYERYRPWLEQNKLQAIAVGAAILYALSLILFPSETGLASGPSPDEAPASAPEGFQPVAGTE